MAAVPFSFHKRGVKARHATAKRPGLDASLRSQYADARREKRQLFPPAQRRAENNVISDFASAANTFDVRHRIASPAAHPSPLYHTGRA